MANTNERMKTVRINGVPYRMRGDMKLPNWRRDQAGGDGYRDYDPFSKGHREYLTTPLACEQKRKRAGDGTARNGHTPVVEWYEVVEEQLDLLPAGFEGLEEVY